MNIIHRILQRIGLYNLIRYSRAYELLLRWRNPDYFINLHHDLEFYKKVIHDKAESLELIFDIGANSGDKCWVFSQIARRVICVEPDPQCQSILTTRFGRQPHITVISAAVGQAKGEAIFHRQQPGSAYNTLSDKHVRLNQTLTPDWKPITVSVTTLDVLIDKYGQPNFLKIDVEGFELEVIRGLSRPIPIICYEANLPGFAEETLAVIDRLITLDPTYRFNVRRAAEYSLLFPTSISADELKQIISTSGPQTYDLFAFQR